MATWFQFSHDFDYHPPERGGRVTVAYKAGTRKFIPEPHAEAAEKAKAGHRITKDGADAGRPAS